MYLPPTENVCYIHKERLVKMQLLKVYGVLDLHVFNLYQEPFGENLFLFEENLRENPCLGLLDWNKFILRGCFSWYIVERIIEFK